MLKSTDANDPRWFVVLDTESAVADRSAHDRYREMERWFPPEENLPSRRGYKETEDPLLTPRWPFQTIAAIAALVLVETAEGNVEVARMATFSARELGEAEMVQGLFDLLSQVPTRAQLVSWSGTTADIPLLVVAAMRAGLSLPPRWQWMAHGADNRAAHIDLCHLLSGNSKAKRVHQSEMAAIFGIPAKVTAMPAAVAGLIESGDFDAVEEVVEGDVICLGLILSRWLKLTDERARHDVVEDRILRQVEELRSHRRYIADLKRHRETLLRRRICAVANDATNEAEAA